MQKHSLRQRFFSADFLTRFLLAIGLLLLAGISVTPFTPPAVVPASATPDSFSAERAMDDLRVVAREPHAAGSAAQSRVRDYLLAQAAAIGLKGEVQKSGSIENVIIRLPGTASTRDVLITAHYDSHPPAPGAGDNGMSVAAMLETMRALRAGSPLRSDTVFLFTDGEEKGFLGASAFVNEFLKAKEETGVVLCFDTRPGNGYAYLNSTSPGNAWLIHEFAAASPPLFANSWRDPGGRDTECAGVFTPSGFMGFEIQNQPRGASYHTSADTVEAISPSTVQGLGEAMMRLGRHFGGVDLNEAPATYDETYFTVPLLGMAIYPTWVTPATAILAMLAFVILAAVGWRSRRLSIPRSVLGTLAFLGALIIITLLSSAAWDRLLATHSIAYDQSIHYPNFEGISSWMGGIMAMAFILGCATLYALSRRIDGVSLAVSGLLVFLIVWWLAYFFLDSVNPMTTPPLAWSFLAGAAGLAILMFVRQRTWMAVLLFLAAVPIFMLTIPALIPETLQPEEGAWVPVLKMGLMLGVLVPQLVFITGRLSFSDAGRGDARLRTA